MKIKHLPGLPLALISLTAAILAGCTTPTPATKSVLTNTATNCLATNATAAVATPAPATDRAHRTIEEFRQAKYPVTAGTSPRWIRISPSWES